MTNDNTYYANPSDAKITGFYFTDRESFKSEQSHHNSSTEEYELKIINGNIIDIELFTDLKITHTNVTDWFDQIQPLTNEEKVGLWFLVCRCGYGLISALEIVQDGLTIFHGTKESWAGAMIKHTRFFTNDNHRTDFDTAKWIHDCESEGSLREFHFGGETWCANPL